MTEGEVYPELRRMRLEPARMQLRVEPAPNWNLDRDQMMAEWRAAQVHLTEIDAVRILMPREDFERLMSIYTSHYSAASRNPAVAEAWHQYKMLVALTERLP